MEWCVIKTGVEMFDMLHASGLGLLIAHAGREPVKLRDTGVHYHLSSTGVPQGSVDLLDDLCALPDHASLEEGISSQTALPIANLDGLLAALYTQGRRWCSVADVLDKQRFHPSAVAQGIAKVRQTCSGWKRATVMESGQPADWIEELLTAYDPTHPCFPMPVATRKETDITAAMTLDPAWGYAPRRQRSDGFVATKTNLTFRGTRCAALLAYIGAMRFLRAQQVNFYVPLTSSLMLHADTTLPLLPRATDLAPDQALLVQWVNYATESPVQDCRWQSMAYQRFQARGVQQSISLERGSLALDWLERLKKQVGQGMLTFWKVLLSQRHDALFCETDHLVEALGSRRAEAWVAHLFEVAQAVQSSTFHSLRAYHLNEVREVTTSMQSSSPIPLSAILARREGTLRFGHALRQLRQFNASAACEAMEALVTVQTRDQLIIALSNLMQECSVAAAKWEFIVIPADPDLTYLLEDVDRYSARTVASLLMLLSTLRYPRATDTQQSVNGNRDEPAANDQEH